MYTLSRAQPLARAKSPPNQLGLSTNRWSLHLMSNGEDKTTCGLKVTWAWMPIVPFAGFDLLNRTWMPKMPSPAPGWRKRKKTRLSLEWEEIRRGGGPWAPDRCMPVQGMDEPHPPPPLYPPSPPPIPPSIRYHLVGPSCPRLLSNHHMGHHSI